MPAIDIPLIAIIVFSTMFFSLLATGAVLVIRDTIRQRGRWGINLKQAVCMQCGTPMPRVRKPANWRQALWGGGTCPECGFELDKWGRPVEQQNTLAKWAVLPAAERAEEHQGRAEPQDDGIRKLHDGTQRQHGS
jgi:hypothetical protein